MNCPYHHDDDRCDRRLGVSGAWPCALRKGHFGPHVTENGEQSTKVYGGKHDHSADFEDPTIKWLGKAPPSAARLAALEEVAGHSRHVLTLLDDGSLVPADVDALRAALAKLEGSRG